MNRDPLSPAETTAIVEDYAPRMKEVARRIWENPELCYLEVETSKLLQAELEEAGFTVESGVAGIPTAFVARAGSAEGPVVGFIAEMDALPGFSQAAVPTPQPVEGTRSGHACGHNLYGTGSVGAAIAVKKWLDRTGTPGQVRVYGTPAEEGGGGKIYMARAGLFSDADAVLRWHPSFRNSAEQSHSLSLTSGVFRFYGQAAHAAMAPERGRSALKAVEAMNFMVNGMREHVPQETRIHYVISDGGAAANVVPDFAAVEYIVRHPDPAVVADVIGRVEKAAEGAATGTGTRYEFEVQNGLYSVLPNDVLGQVMHRNLERVGPPQWSADDLRFAETLQQSMQNRPPLAAVGQIGAYRFGGLSFVSSDSGDVSWVAPTVGLEAVSWVPGTAPHTWQAVAAGGMDIGFKGMTVAAKTMAGAAAELLAQPELLRAARAEFDKARGEGFEYRPLIGGRNPPLDYMVSSV